MVEERRTEPGITAELWMRGAAEADPQRKADGRGGIGRESRTSACCACFGVPASQAWAFPWSPVLTGGLLFMYPDVSTLACVGLGRWPWQQHIQYSTTCPGIDHDSSYQTLNCPGYPGSSALSPISFSRDQYGASVRC